MAAAPLPASSDDQHRESGDAGGRRQSGRGGLSFGSCSRVNESKLRGMVWVKAKMVLAVAAIGLAAGGAGWVGYEGMAGTGQAGVKVGRNVWSQKQPEFQREEKGGARDQNGDPLPPAAIARLGTLRFRQEGFVEDLIDTVPYGKTLISRGGWLKSFGTHAQVRNSIAFQVSRRIVMFHPFTFRLMMLL